MFCNFLTSPIHWAAWVKVFQQVRYFVSVNDFPSVYFVSAAESLILSAVFVDLFCDWLFVFCLTVVGGYLGNGTITPIPRALPLGLSKGVPSQVTAVQTICCGI